MASKTVFPQTPVRDPNIVVNAMKGGIPDLEDFLELSGREVFLGTERVQISEGFVTVLRYQGHSARTFKLLSHYGVLHSPKDYLTNRQLDELITIEKRRLEEEYGRKVQIDFF